MLAGLIFRGVAFEFRFKAERSRNLWNWAFAGGSMVAAFAQGAVVGAYIEGFNTVDGRYVGGPLDWLSPFTVLTGLGLVAGYALLGSTWLVLKTEGYIQQWVRRLAPWLLLVVLGVFAAVSVWTPLVDPSAFERWFSVLRLIWIFPALALLSAWLVWRGVRRQHHATPFMATMAMFAFTYFGLLVTKWPYVVPPNYTLWDAASAPGSQLFLLIGVLFVIPVILAYTAWTYWVFRGKVRAGEGYHGGGPPRHDSDRAGRALAAAAGTGTASPARAGPGAGLDLRRAVHPAELDHRRPVRPLAAVCQRGRPGDAGRRLVADSVAVSAVAPLAPVLP